MIYTSYFAKAKKIPEDVMRFTVCRSIPSWYKGNILYPLMPTEDDLWYIKNIKNEEEFTRRYYENTLSLFDPKDVQQYLKEKANGKDVVLLCYEKSSAFCHRHLISKWFNDAGIACKEW